MIDDEVVKKIGFKKMAMASIKTFSVLCRQCKRRAVRNPKLDMTEFCNICQTKVRKILNPLVENANK